MEKIFAQIEYSNGSRRVKDAGWESTVWTIYQDGSFEIVDDGCSHVVTTEGVLSDGQFEQIRKLLKDGKKEKAELRRQGIRDSYGCDMNSWSAGTGVRGLRSRTINWDRGTSVQALTELGNLLRAMEFDRAAPVSGFSPE